MKAIVLAAGRGKRMRPLTDHTPKPLLPVHGTPLIEWHLRALARAGVRDVVVNTDWLEQDIVRALGDGARFGCSIRYSMEGRDCGGALETAGGIKKALPWLIDHATDAFWVVSADIHAPQFDFATPAVERFERSDALAHLWLVPNPLYHPRGDFGLAADGWALADGAGPDGQTWTYANLALCRGALFDGVASGSHAALGPLLYAAMRERRITAEVYTGAWDNVGTPAQWEALNRAAGAPGSSQRAG
jgi:MurNAc alpha-1-phosphate uridylyltransferase